MPRLRKDRLAVLGALLLAGLLYRIFISATGLGIPCPFRTVTGLKCPGCGITHMAVSLTAFRFREAATANPFLFYTSPLLLLFFSDLIFRWLTEQKPRRLSERFACCYAVCLVIFGIVRNIPGFKM